MHFSSLNVICSEKRDRGQDRKCHDLGFDSLWTSSECGCVWGFVSISHFFLPFLAFRSSIRRQWRDGLKEKREKPIMRASGHFVMTFYLSPFPPSGPVLRTTATTISVMPPHPALWGFGCLNMNRLGGIPLPRACALEVRYPLSKRGISAILARYQMKTRQKACDTPSAIRSRKGIVQHCGGLALGR